MLTLLPGTRLFILPPDVREVVVSPTHDPEEVWPAASSLGDVTRANLQGRVVHVLNRGRARNPDVFLVDTGEGVVVVKDFSPRAPWVRSLFGPWINRREIRAYRALDGHFAVPRLFGELDAQAFVLEYRPGHYVSRRQAKQLSPTFLDELTQAIEEMHARGVVHLDLRHRTNILLGRDGHPVLLDFASALVARPGSLCAKLLRFLFGGVDYWALEKWRERLTPPPAPPTPPAAS